MKAQKTSRYPVNFDAWDYERRLNHMEVMYSRRGLIFLNLTLAGYETSREIDSKTRLRKEELAALALALDPKRETTQNDTLHS